MDFIFSAVIEGLISLIMCDCCSTALKNPLASFYYLKGLALKGGGCRDAVNLARIENCIDTVNES